MSYSIIFETKFVKLPDGRIIHFDRSGCNNDDAGRCKDEFRAKIYQNEEELTAYAQGFMKDSKPYKESKEFELKIGSRICSMYDYGAHLLRMYKRALSVEDFNAKHPTDFWCREYIGAEIYEPEKKTLNATEAKAFFDNYFSGKMNGVKSIRYRNIYETYYRLDQKVIDLITQWNNKWDSPISFRIGY